MIGISSSFSASATSNYTVQLFQSANLSSTTEEGGTLNASMTVYGSFSSATSQAIESIIRIVMDNQGNTDIFADSDGTVSNVKTDDGNDTINISASQVFNLNSGDGDDVINIETYTGEHTAPDFKLGKLGVIGIDAGAGNDSVTLSGDQAILGVSTGAGDDTIAIKTSSAILRLDTGDGADTVAINALTAAQINAGAGSDTVAIRATYANGVDGGDGDDDIAIEARAIYGVTGGKGDDTIIIDNEGNEAAQFFFSEGDGNDTITTDGALEITFFSEDGTTRLDMANTSWQQNGNTITISFGDSGDSLTVHLEGDIAADSGVDIAYNAENGALRIGSQQEWRFTSTISLVDSSESLTRLDPLE